MIVNTPKQNNLNMDLNLQLLIPPPEVMSSNRLSSELSNNRIFLLKNEKTKSNTLFNTFSSNKTNISEKKNQKISNNIINIKEKPRTILKAKSANHKKIKSYYDYIEEEKNKDSYIYLVNLRKYYSMNNYNKNNNRSKYKSQSHKTKKIKTRVNNNKEVNNTNNYYTINNYYINSKLRMTIGSNTNQKNNIFNNIIQRNISHSYFNKTKEFTNNDISEIINTRKKFNETYNHFYEIRNSDLNKNSLKINKIDTSEYSTMNDYWKKRSKDNVKKIVKIRNELMKKGKNKIQSVPKISNKSKELANNSNKSKIDRFKFNNIFDKLFQKKTINHSHTTKERYINKPKINEKSEKMVRTIDDLYLWNNKRKKRIKENETQIYKKEIFKKKNINLTSETLLKERRPFYTNKKVEDRLIEQGKNINNKKSRMKEKSLKELTEQRKYLNINYNHNNRIKSKYLPKEESKNNDINNNSKMNKNNNIFNFNYDYSINAFNKRTALFDKSKSNIIQELKSKYDEEGKGNNFSKSILLHNYMQSKIHLNKNNVKINYNVTDIESSKEKSKIEQLKLGLTNNNYEKNNFSVIKNMNMDNNSEITKKEKNSNIFQIKDKRMEDLQKIIDFSDKLYKNQNKINS